MGEKDAGYYKAKHKEHAIEAAQGLEKLDHMLHEMNATKWAVRDALDFISKVNFGEQETPESREHFGPLKDAPGYVEGADPLAVQFAPTATSQVGQTRQWDNHELYISWRQPGKFSHWRGGAL